jgi:U3 small nucleolar RNA-associated protein 20
MLRVIAVAELYDLILTVSSILVASQSAHTHKSARSHLLQFLLDYPQGTGRPQTGTITFLARNRSYEHVPGRSSILGLMAKQAQMLMRRCCKADMECSFGFLGSTSQR